MAGAGGGQMANRPWPWTGFVRIVVIVAVCCGPQACAKSSQPAPASPSIIPRTLDLAGGRPLTEGETVTPIGPLHGINGETTDASSVAVWSSDTPAVATVDNRGVVTAVAPGSAQIRAVVKEVSATTALAVAAAFRLVHGGHHQEPPTGPTNGAPA